MTESGAFRYRAFISYRHRDKAWGDWLHRALESYRVPARLVGTPGRDGPVPARLAPIFRDREELAAAADLSAEIQAALAASAKLVVICSPGAAASRFVNAEILAFKQLGKADRIFAIIVAGEANAVDPADECFPPALKYELEADGTLSNRPAEPIAADARDEGDGKENARLKLIAGLLGVGYDQLRRREAETQRRRFRRLTAIAGTLVLVFAALAAAAIWFGIDASRQNAKARAAIRTADDAARAIIYDLAEEAKYADGAQAALIEKLLVQAQKLLDGLAEAGGNDQGTMHSRAVTLDSLAQSKLVTGDLATAEKLIRESIALTEELVRLNPGIDVFRYELGNSYGVLGNILRRQGRGGEAEASYVTALDHLRPLAAKSPGDPDTQASYLHAAIPYAFVLNENGKSGEADAVIRSAVETGKAALAAHPDNVEIAGALARAYDTLGDLMRFHERFPEAIAAYRESLAICERLAAAAPGDPLQQESLAIALAKAAQNELEVGHTDEADRLYTRSYGINEKLAASDPDDLDYQHGLAISCTQMMSVAQVRYDLNAAFLWANKAETILGELVKRDPANATWVRDLETVRGYVREIRRELGFAP